jgi:hypothetical protein
VNSNDRRGYAVKQDSHATVPAFIVLAPTDIAVRAYGIYLERGASDGFDRDVWFRAERELKARGKRTGRRRRRG